jgi:CRISPR-associated protein Cmr1
VRTHLRPPLPLPTTRAVTDEVIILELEAVTPIYRGGASPEAIDTERPFRASAIRGLLRHWWRATRPETDPRDLWEREASLFGAIRRGRAVASRVRVGVVGPSSHEGSKPEGVEYALWVHGNKDKGKKLYHERAKATLTLQVPADRASEIHHALSAWLLLGGIGSRSRRGLGAVHAFHPSIRPELSTIEALAAHVARFAPDPASRRWPSLGGGCVLVGPAARGPLEAWTAAVRQMQALRQYPAVRRWHDDDYVVFTAGRSFVSRRAALGLPLQFQKRDGPGKWRMTPIVKGAPKADRVPSPIHLRPVLIGGHWHPLMSVLRVPYPDRLKVTGTDEATGTIDPQGVQWFVDALVQAGWTHHVLRRQP